MQSVYTFVQRRGIWRPMQKTFQDLILNNAYHPEWIKQNLKTAIEKKIISLEEIKKISINNEVKQIFNAILFELSD